MQKKHFGILLVGILAIVGYNYYQKAHDFIDTVTFKVHKVKVDVFASLASLLKTIVLPTIFTIDNTTTFAGTIDKIDLDFFYKGKKVGNVISNEKFKIAPNAATPIPTIIKISTVELKKIVGSINDLLNAGFAMDVKGVVTTSFGNVKVNETISV